MSTTVVVGCPARRRAWVLPRWFQAVEVALDEAGITEYAYAFVLDPHDTETVDVVHDWTRQDRCDVSFVAEEERADLRRWDEGRWHHMVRLRNELLRTVRQADPFLFWSLDSDILAHPQSLALARASLFADGYEAMGMKCFMTHRGVETPSYGRMYQGKIARFASPHAEGPWQVDVIMAAKLMRKTAYNVDYRWHLDGEDVGWSLACAEKGLSLGWDGRVVSRHVMGCVCTHEIGLHVDGVGACSIKECGCVVFAPEFEETRCG